MSGAGSSGRRSHCVPGMKRAVAVGAVLAALAGLASCSQPSAAPHSATSTAAGVPGHVPAPAVVASGLHFPVNLTFDSHGGLWFTSNVVGGKNDPTDGVWYIPPGGRPRQVVTGLAPAGLVWVGNRLYVASTTTPGHRPRSRSWKASTEVASRASGSGSTASRWGKHLIGSIAPGPDGHLYIGTLAPRCNSGPPGNVLSFAPDGGSPVGEGNRPAECLRACVLRPALARDRHRARRPWRLPAAREAQRAQPGRPMVNFGYPGCYGQGGSACAGTRRRSLRSPRTPRPPGLPSRATLPSSPRTARRSCRTRAGATSSASTCAPDSTRSSGARRSSMIPSARPSAGTETFT